MRGFILLALLLPACAALAQTVNITKIELAGDKVVVHYDLEDSNPNNEYKLELYGSRDNFIAPLTKVNGDIGPEVKPGAGRKVEWNIREEYGNYKGKVALEVKGKVYIPFVKLQNFDTKKGYKRGTSMNLAWKAGNSNPVSIELFKGGQRIAGDNSLPNNGSHTLYIPSNAKPGNDYRLKITDARNTEDVIYTNNFAVKPKVPLVVKILPAVAVAAVVAFLGGGSGGGDTGGGSGGDPEIPAPPAAPTGG
jgi:hypothetical protein